MTSKQIRASFDDSTIRVYQAYPAAIADAATAAGTFVPPFRMERMTWIKPSFLWMAYRCGYASKPGQERVLAVDVDRQGFAWALRNSSLSHYDRAVHRGRDEWRESLRKPVRVQWDPERDLRHRPLDHRSIQIGLSGEGVTRYVGEWIKGITDITELMHAVGGHVARGRLDEATALLPFEAPYPFPEDVPIHIVN
ncbi:DUF4291 domain-containing protein [Stackebrandtia soli]|uniref:DUF4291 domain-containing protein n=1 Tax=Stackebrandtia soli TaxID=1892856 RepID=UPI0039E8C278